MSANADFELIPLSALQHWQYCPRQCGLIHLEQVFDDNVHTLRGQAVHARADRPGVETAKGAMATAGVDLNINPTWFARADVRYLQDTTGQPNVAVDGVNVGKAELNPIVLGVGIGARF